MWQGYISDGHAIFVSSIWCPLPGLFLSRGLGYQWSSMARQEVEKEEDEKEEEENSITLQSNALHDVDNGSRGLATRSLLGSTQVKTGGRF